MPYKNAIQVFIPSIKSLPGFKSSWNYRTLCWQEKNMQSDFRPKK